MAGNIQYGLPDKSFSYETISVEKDSKYLLFINSIILPFHSKQGTVELSLSPFSSLECNMNGGLY